MLVTIQNLLIIFLIETKIKKNNVSSVSRHLSFQLRNWTKLPKMRLIIIAAATVVVVLDRICKYYARHWNLPTVGMSHILKIIISVVFNFFCFKDLNQDDHQSFMFLSLIMYVQKNWYCPPLSWWWWWLMMLYGQ